MSTCGVPDYRLAWGIFVPTTYISEVDVKKKGCLIAYLAVLGMFILGIIVIKIIEHPNPDPADVIRNQVLEQTPIGMSMDDVLEIIQSNDEWKLDFVNYNNGFRISYEPGQTWIGEKSISASLEPYYPLGRLYFSSTISIFWGFDKDEKLIEVLTRRDSSFFY